MMRPNSPVLTHSLLGAILALALAGALLPAQAEPAALCTDRPTKSTGTCTADDGHVQIESDLVSFSQSHEGAVTATTWVLLNPTIKYGVTESLDVEAAAALAVNRGAGAIWQ